MKLVNYCELVMVMHNVCDLEPYEQLWVGKDARGADNRGGSWLSAWIIVGS